MTTGELVDSMERRQLVQVGLAPQLVSPERKRPQEAMNDPSESYPQGIPRGGENEIPKVRLPPIRAFMDDLTVATHQSPAAVGFCKAFRSSCNGQG